MVTRQGITDAKSFIKSVIKDGAESVEFLKSACVGKEILAQVEAGIQEELSNADWTDVEVRFKLAAHSCNFFLFLNCYAFLLMVALLLAWIVKFPP